VVRGRKYFYIDFLFLKWPLMNTWYLVPGTYPYCNVYMWSCGDPSFANIVARSSGSPKKQSDLMVERQQAVVLSTASADDKQGDSNDADTSASSSASTGTTSNTYFIFHHSICLNVSVCPNTDIYVSDIDCLYMYIL
jgi:hypothetical protein